MRKKIVVTRPEHPGWMGKSQTFARDGAAQFRQTLDTVDAILASIAPGTPGSLSFLERNSALNKLLCNLDDPRVAAYWLGAFHDPDWRVRETATGFAMYRDWNDLEPKLVDETLRLAREDPSETVRLQAWAKLTTHLYLNVPAVFQAAIEVIKSGDEDATQAILRWSNVIPMSLTNCQLPKMYDAMFDLLGRLPNPPTSEDQRKIRAGAIDTIHGIEKQAVQTQ